MNDNINLAPHEAIGLRELMNTSIIGYKTANVTLPLIQNEELKGFLSNSLNAKKASIEEMQSFISKTNIDQR